MDKMSQKVEFSIVQSFVIEMEVPANADNNEICTNIDFKKEVFSDGPDESHKDFVEANESEELHTSYEIKEEISDGSSVIPTGPSFPSESEPFSQIQSGLEIKEEISDGGLVIPTGPSFPSESEPFIQIQSGGEPSGDGLHQNKKGIEADLLEQCSATHGNKNLTGENPFKCEDCNFSSRWKQNLSRHSVICSRKKSVQRRSLRQHLNTDKNAKNNEERQFSCKGCDFSSKWKKNLLRHSLICTKRREAQRKGQSYLTTNKNKKRTEERTFKCDGCDFNSRWERSLRRHLLICSTKESTENLQQHSNDKKITEERPFKCDGCDFNSTLERSLRRHLLICNTKESTENLQQHSNDKKITEERPFKCDGCGFKFNWKQNLCRHSLICNRKESTRKVNHQKHLTARSSKKLAGERPFKCDSCTFTSTWKQNLVHHLIICNRKKSTHKIGQQHLNTEMHKKQSEQGKTNRREVLHQQSTNPENISQSGIEQFKCGCCNFSSKYKHNLVRHSMICSNKNSNQGESLQQPSTATKHKKRTVGRTFKCDSCNFIFKWKHHLRRHLLTCKGKRSTFSEKDAGVKLFKCGSCDFSSSWKRSLRRHLLTCIKTKSSRIGNRQGHLAIHTNKRQTGDIPFKCNRCNFSSRWRQNLWRHSSNCSGMKLNSTREKAIQHSTNKQERPYNCKTCDKSFKYEYMMNRHLLNHTLVASFKCSICDKIFAQRSNLRQHMSNHRREEVRHENFTEGVVIKGQLGTPTKGNSFRCERCNRKFHREEELRSHLVTHMN